MNVFGRYQNSVNVASLFQDEYMKFNARITDISMRGGLLVDTYSDSQEKMYQSWSSQFEKATKEADYIVGLSKFSVNEVVPSLVEMVSLFEGCNYSCEKAALNIDGNMSQILLIVDERYKQQCYSSKELDLFSKTGKTLVLSQDSTLDYFYSYSNERKLYPNINFGVFGYIKEFLDRIICYKDENKVNNISSALVSEMKDQFVLDNIEFIEEVYKNKDQNQTKEIALLTDEIEQRKKMFQKVKSLKASSEN